MKLHEGKLFFNQNKIETKLTKLNKDLKCDVLVIGGGITGLILCEKLISKGKNVLLIEKDDIAVGSSSANTGLLQWMSDKTLTSMINEKSEGLKLYKDSVKAINYIEDTVNKYNLNCDFKRLRSIYHPSTKDDIEMLKEEYNTLLKHHFNVLFKNNKLISNNDASMNCYSFTKELFNQLKSKLTTYKATIYNVKNNIAYTKDYQIKFNEVIFTTGYNNLHFKNNKDCILEKTHVIITKPVTNNICDMIWETKRPYLYIKPVKNRILIGGLDRKDDKLTDYTTKNKILLKDAMNLLKRNDLEIDYSYSALFGSTHSGFPHLVKEKGIYYFYNMGGNGVLYSCILSNKIIKQIII